uniref:CEP170 C-terminal domain-containing protein n=1 Tax=Xiphophorus couchianus TaxID=32473 RepID=A0A3B5MXQ5_9TELE
MCVFVTETPGSRPTPLYGQPSWWGEEDYGSKVQNFPGALSDSQPKTVFPSYHREPSYFEIPTKDFQHQKTSEAELHEIPTKDTDAPNAPPTPTPPVVQSHASFTIEFDDCMPGKIKIKDHVTKFSTRQRKGQAPPAKTAATATPAEMMSAQSKVADWLVHSDVSMMRRHPPCEDVYSTKSDLAMNIKTLKGQRGCFGFTVMLYNIMTLMVSPPHAQNPFPQEPPALSLVSYPSSPLQPPVASKSFKPAIGPAQVAPLGHPSGPHMSPMLSLGVHGGDPKISQRIVRNEEDDSLSDAGTYTIETESQDKEVEEARNMIDQVRSQTRDPPAKTPPTTVLIRHLSGHEPRRTGVKPNNSAPNLQTQDKDSVPTKDSCIVRQESFTKDQPSDTVQMKKLPHISSHPSIRDMEQSIQETQPFLQETEGALSSLDTKVPSSGSGRSSKKEGSSTHMDDSLSGESDVDTASTVSQVSSKNAPVSSTSKKRPAISSFQKEKSSSSPSIQEKGRQLSARERLSEKRRTQTTDVPSKAEATKRFQMRRSTGNRGSLDLSEGQQGTAPNWTETTSSDHEISHPSSRTKKVIAPLQKEDNGKTPKSAAQQVLTRSNSLSAPRPTRASMLRRARLGDASDNEGTETDRTSQNSDHISAPPKVSAEGKKLSRLDILAMPRKRTGSFTTPSDNESSTSRSGFSGRNSEPAVTARKTSVGDARQAASKGGGAPVKQTVLSQDLAKDLAILAKEIHDVAGDGDPPPTATSPSSLPNTPGSNISAREELVHRIPEASLNFQKVPPGSAAILDLDANMNEAEPTSLQRRPWNREEVILDNLMLNPVSQLSQAIRENTEQLAEKMKVLFQNKADVWEEIEAKINTENEVPILKTSNKEITSILKELRRVQRQRNPLPEPEPPTPTKAPSDRLVGLMGPTTRPEQAAVAHRDRRRASTPLRCEPEPESLWALCLDRRWCGCTGPVQNKPPICAQ